MTDSICNNIQHLNGAFSISDDDLCSDCMYLHYCPGQLSICSLIDALNQWPCMFNKDGYATFCKKYKRKKEKLWKQLLSDCSLHYLCMDAKQTQMSHLEIYQKPLKCFRSDALISKGWARASRTGWGTGIIYILLGVCGIYYVFSYSSILSFIAAYCHLLTKYVIFWQENRKFVLNPW